MSDSGDSGQLYVCPCDHCGQHLEFPKEGKGTEIECPSCHKSTVLRFDFDLFIEREHPEKRDNPDGQSVCYCMQCWATFNIPNKLIGEWFDCPQCGEEILLLPDSGILSRIEMFRMDYNRCPKCSSAQWQVYEPSKPIVFGPMTFTGQLLAGISNCMADSIFRPERVCSRCGHHWQQDD
jgi:DNA-directed RNA polymerase subunit RPC12/RpoP